MAVLWLLFIVLKYVSKLSSLQLYLVAITLQAIGFAGFIFFLFKQPYSSNNFEIYWSHENLNIATYASVAYILITCFFFVKLVVALSKLKQMANHIQPANVYFQTFVQNIIDTYLPNKHVVIKWVNNKATVFMYHVVNPVIVLPIACINDLNEDELKAIILHEIAHIKYAHFIVNIWVEFVNAILWFNPFNYWLCQEINFYREASADAFVLQQMPHKYNYANGLYKLAKQQVLPKQPMGLSAVYNKNELRKRIQHFTKPSKEFQFSAKAFFVSVLTFVFFIGINKIANQPQKQISQQSQLNNFEKPKQKANAASIKEPKKQTIKKESEDKKIIVKQSKEQKPSSIYLLKDKKAFAQGLKFLSELAIQYPTVKAIVTENPTIQPVALLEDDNKEFVRRFIIPATKNKGAVLVKIIVEQKAKSKQKVTIELEEQPLFEAS